MRVPCEGSRLQKVERGGEERRGEEEEETAEGRADRKAHV